MRVKSLFEPFQSCYLTEIARIKVLENKRKNQKKQQQNNDEEFIDVNCGI